MKKYLIFSSFLLILIMLAGVALAAVTPTPSTTHQTILSKDGATVKIPSRAVEVSPGIFSLGRAVDPQSGQMVEGYAILKYKDNPVKFCGNGICEPGENATKCPTDCSSQKPETSSCYGFLARGAKWKIIEPYLVDATNSQGLSDSFIKSNLAFNISKWETAAGTNILGDETTGAVDGADEISPDGKNEIYFGSIDSQGAIAVTIVWGVFSGPPRNRQLVEWDMVFDQVDYSWASDGNPLDMDFENIATHELGHSAGMNDLYTLTCNQETMYGYASEGETIKRDLNLGDITGIKELY